MKRLLSILLLLTMSVSMFAADFDKMISGIYYKIDGTDATVVAGNNPYKGNVIIPEHFTISGTKYTVVAVAEQAFAGCADLELVSVPASVTSIGKEAFKNCTGLRSAGLSASVTTIGTSMFEGCTSLEWSISPTT